MPAWLVGVVVVALRDCDKSEEDYFVPVPTSARCVWLGWLVVVVVVALRDKTVKKICAGVVGVVVVVTLRDKSEEFVPPVVALRDCDKSEEEDLCRCGVVWWG